MRIFNNTILIDSLGIIGCSKYFKEFELYNNNYKLNRKLATLIDLIGKQSQSEFSKKKYSNRKKGLVFIKNECLKKYKEPISITEIKSLIKPYKRKISGKFYIKCPYNMDYILKTIVNIASNDSKIKEIFNRIFKTEFSNNEEFDKNCYNLLLSIYYVNLKKKICDWDELNFNGKKLYFENSYKRLSTLKERLNNNFQNKCEILN